MSSSRYDNANTSSPVLVNSRNEPVDVSNWRKGLIGQKFMAYSGDHILPMVNNPTIKVTKASSVLATITTAGMNNEVWHIIRPAGEQTAISSKTHVVAFGDQSLLSLNGGSALVESDFNNPQIQLTVVSNTKDKDFPTAAPTETRLPICALALTSTSTRNQTPTLTQIRIRPVYSEAR